MFTVAEKSAANGFCNGIHSNKIGEDMKNINSLNDSIESNSKKVSKPLGSSKIAELITFFDVVNDKSIPPAPIVGNGVLLDKTILQIVGEAKSKKTFLTLNMTLAMASGRSFAGFSVEKPSRVLHLSSEGGYFPTRERIQTMAKGFNEEALRNIYSRKYVNMSIDVDDDYRELQSWIEETKPDVLVFDPLIRFHSQDENSSTAMNIVFRRFRELIDKYNLSIIIVHHTGKNTSLGGRGSSLIRGEYDSCITLKKLGDNHKLSFDMRHVETPSPRILSFNKDTFWFEASATDDKVVEYLTDNGSISKAELIHEWVSSDTFSSSHCYRLIDKAISRGHVREGEDGKLHLFNEE